MSRAYTIKLILGFCASAPFAAAPAVEGQVHWPNWRGPTATGAAPDADPPLTWSESDNIRWKTSLPGKGSASPVVWGSRIFVSTAVKTDRPAEPPRVESLLASVPADRRDIARSVHDAPKNLYRFMVLAYDRADGHELWRRVVREECPIEAGHPEGSLASASPVTDGKHVYAFFGSRGLYCLTMDGEPVWETDLGDMITRRGHGEGSSPALFDDTLVVNWDHEGDSFIVALDKHTGKEKWRRPRDEFTSWATPLVLPGVDRAQVVVSATNRIRSYDLLTGREIWACGGMTVNAIPSPVAGHDLVFVLSGYRGDALRAIRFAGARGDITDSAAIAWSYDKGMPYVPSPLLYDNKLYFIAKNRPMISCFDANTGRGLYVKQRLKGMRAVYASPVGAGGRVYVVGRDGVTKVIRHGPSFEILATNTLDDGFDASPAIVGRAIILRGRSHLYCVSAE